MRHRDRHIGDLIAVDALAKRLEDGLLDRLQERERQRPELDLQAELDA